MSRGVCEICRRDEVVAGKKLCVVCGEAILRLANAITAVQAGTCEEPANPRAEKYSADECAAVLFSDWR